MDDQQLNQRIQYLVEHGGIWDDPLAQIRKRQTWHLIALGVLVLLEVARLFSH